MTITQDTNRIAWKVARRFCLATSILCCLFLSVSCTADKQAQQHVSTATDASVDISLLVGAISKDLTIRIVITPDGGSVASIDSYTYFADDYVFTSGIVPLSHTETHLLPYGNHLFEYEVYDGLVTESTVSTATLLGSTSQMYLVNSYLETIPAVTINLSDGDDATETLSFFPAAPTFTAYTVYDPSTSSTQTAGKYSSIDLDSYDQAHISFLYEDTSTSSKRLGYTFGNESTWETPWLLLEDNSGDTNNDNIGEHTSLKIDSSDGVHISYYDSTLYDLRYIYIDSEDTAFGSSEEVAKGPSASYPAGQYSSMNLYEKFENGKWSAAPYITYYDVIGAASTAMTVGYHDSSAAWVNYYVNTSVSSGKFSSSTLDANGVLHMAYMRKTSGISYLRYAKCQIPPSFSACFVPSANIFTLKDGVEQNIRIDVDSQGKVHMVYYDYNTLSLKYTYGNGSTWTTETIDNSSSSDVGQFSDISVSADGVLHVAYYDGINGDLLYKQRDPSTSTWSAAVVIDGASDNVGQYVSLELNEADATVHVSYYDVTNQQLKYAVSQ